MNLYDIGNKVGTLEREMYTKANAYELDRANSRIRTLEEELRQETVNRQGAEHRLGLLDERIQALEAAANQGTV